MSDATLLRYPFPADLDAIEAAWDREIAADDAGYRRQQIETAITALRRGLSTERIGMVREAFLSDAADALYRADLPDHAERIEGRMDAIGGTDDDLERLVGELQHMIEGGQ